MAISVRYPSNIPSGVDANAILGAFNNGFDRSRDMALEKQGNAAWDQYVSSLYGQSGGLSDLGKLAGPQAPQAASLGAVQRAPLADVPDMPTQRVEAAFAAQGQGRGDINSNQIAGRFLKTVRDGGLTNPYGLAAVAATGKRESGFDPKNATRTWSDPSQSGVAGTAGGIMSWRGDRLAALQQFAQQNGDDPRAPSPETQGKFLLSEDPSLVQKLNAAKSPQEAQQIMNNAWRYAGYDQAGGETAQRMALAEQYAPQFGGQSASPSQQALEGLAVGGSTPMGQGAPQAQVADASGRTMPQNDPSSLLPPREVMQALFRSPSTRPLAVGLAQAVMKMRAGNNDPQAQIEYQIAVEKLRQLRDPQSKLINAGGGQIYDPNTKQWISPPSADGETLPFTGKSVEAQALNGLIQSGQLTKDQALQLGAGKTITDPSTGAIIFMTPQGVFGQSPQGGQPQPISPNEGASPQGTQPQPATAPGMLPITGGKANKPTEGQTRNRQLYQVIKPEAKIVEDNFAALSNLADQAKGVLPGSDYLTSQEYQRARNSLKTIVASYLYSVSGATANPGEVQNQIDILTPKPGESKKSIEDKLARIKTMVDAVRTAGGEDAPQGSTDYKSKYGLD